MSEDLPSPPASKSSLAAGAAGVVVAGGLGAAGFAEMIPSEKLIELGMGGAAIVALLFVVTRFLSHIRSEGKANRDTLDGLGKAFAVFSDRVEDKIDSHAHEMRDLIGRPPPAPTSRGGRSPHLHVVSDTDPELPSRRAA